MELTGNDLLSTLNVESFLKLETKLSFYEEEKHGAETESGDLNVCKIINDVIKNAVNN